MSPKNKIFEQKKDKFNRLQRSLGNSDLIHCSLCSKVLNEPVVVNCCTSRYCLKCLQSYNRSNDQTCPNCESLLENKPFVIDNAFATVIRLTKLDINEFCSSRSSDLLSRISPSKSSDEILNLEPVNLVLWPDASTYNMPLPLCIKQPRFIQVAEKTTVAQLTEFLFLRMEIESNTTGFRKQYKVEFTNVIKEHENVDSSCLPKAAKFLYKNNVCQASNDEFSNMSLMLAIRNSFEPVSSELSVQQLIDKFWLDMSKPFKLLFRFTLLAC